MWKSKKKLDGVYKISHTSAFLFNKTKKYLKFTKLIFYQNNPFSGTQLKLLILKEYDIYLCMVLAARFSD
jgi:hypothetical protein